MSRPARSIPEPSPPSQRSPSDSPSPLRAVRDRDYLLDRCGVIFKVIGDVHPDGHYLGYVKYHPDERGDRRLFGQAYRQNTVVSKSFGILADRPECYVYSPVLGCVITGLPRQDILTVDEPETFARRITYLRSYLGAYTGAFRSGDTVHLSGKLVYLQDGVHGCFGIELTPWSVSKSYLANLTG